MTKRTRATRAGDEEDDAPLGRLFFAPENMGPDVYAVDDDEKA